MFFASSSTKETIHYHEAQPVNTSRGGGTAVLLSGTRRNVAIKNGHIRETTTVSGSTFSPGGFLDGVRAATSGTNLRVSDLNVHGMADDGIDLFNTNAPTCVVERCTVSICEGEGIRAALVRDCSVDGTGVHAILGGVVTNSSGRSVGPIGMGISSDSIVENSRGQSVGGTGIIGDNVSNSQGASTSATGLFATTATNCQGSSTSSTGLNATNATNCQGNSSSGGGLTSTNATNCRGISTTSTGLTAITATNCQGTSTSGPFGLSVTGTASYCRGQRDAGTAISASIAIGCTVNGSGTVTGLKHLGTP